MMSLRTACFCLLAIPLGSAIAQHSAHLTEGTRMRVQVADSTSRGTERVRIVGQFLSLTPDSLLVRVGMDGVSRIPRRRIAEVAVAQGKKHPFVRDVFVGGATGFLVGVAGKRTTSTRQNCGDELGQYICRGVKPPIREVTGTLIGLATGFTFAMVGRPDWKRVIFVAY